MSPRSLRSIVILAGLAFVAVTAVLGGSAAGEATYQSYCVTCHGEKGKGDGQLAKILTVKPADLTRIAERNGGQFPADEVRAKIDGRKSLPTHGPSDMPVWGDAFSQSEQAGGPEAVQARIDELVAHLRSMQVVEKK